MEFRFRAGDDRPHDLQKREEKKASIREEMIAREMEEKRILEEEVRRELDLEREARIRSFQRERGRLVEPYQATVIGGYERDWEVRGFERYEMGFPDPTRFAPFDAGYREDFHRPIDDRFRMPRFVPGNRSPLPFIEHEPRFRVLPVSPAMVYRPYFGREPRFRELLPVPEVVCWPYIGPEMRFRELPAMTEVVSRRYIEPEPRLKEDVISRPSIEKEPTPVVASRPSLGKEIKFKEVPVAASEVVSWSNVESQPRFSEPSAAPETKPSGTTLSGFKRKAIACPDGGKPATREFACALCQISASSKEALDDHLHGKKHKAKVEKLSKPTATSNKEGSMATANRNKTAEDKSKKTEVKLQHQGLLWCNLCKVKVNSASMMETHHKGKKHLAKDAAGKNEQLDC